MFVCVFSFLIRQFLISDIVIVGDYMIIKKVHFLYESIWIY